MKSDRKSTFERTPVSPRQRPGLRSNARTPQGPSVSSRKTLTPSSTPTPNRSRNMEESPVPPEYRSLSCDLKALAKMVQDDFGNFGDLGNAGLANSAASPLFERGRFYDEYSARRNERLRKKKKSETGDERKVAYGLGVNVESAKRRGDSKKLEHSLRKSMPSAVAKGPRENPIPRYSLRSSKV